MKLTTVTATIAALSLSGCATMLDAFTSLDETTSSQQATLEGVRASLVAPGGGTLPEQLARTEEAVVRLAGGASDGRSLADLGASLDQANEGVEGLHSILEGVLANTESLVWPEGAAPNGEKSGGSILKGVYDSTSRIAGIVPSGSTLTLIGGVALGLLLALVGRLLFRRP